MVWRRPSVRFKAGSGGSGVVWLVQARCRFRRLAGLVQARLRFKEAQQLSAQLRSGSPEIRFHEGSTRVPPRFQRFHEGASTKASQGTPPKLICFVTQPDHR